MGLYMDGESIHDRVNPSTHITAHEQESSDLQGGDELREVYAQ
jgi:hypothetical protein